MPNPARRRNAVWALVAVLAMVVAVTLGAAAHASAVTSPHPGMRVRAFNPVAENAVPATCVSFPRSHRGPPAWAFLEAVGACVARETGVTGLPDDARVLRGGAEITPESISNGTGVHPCGIEGFSAESAPGATVEDLATWIPNNKIGVTTVGAIRGAGGEVTPTSGRSLNDVTVSGLEPVVASTLFSPSRKNPVPRDERLVFQ